MNVGMTMLWSLKWMWCFRHNMFGNVVGESKLSNERIPWRFDDSILSFIIWLVLSDEQMSKR